ncbi:MAG: DNA polymerase III subunit delta' [Trueperella sp.]|uniref:DNA polymerase III subunit delta' n=1 Tax=Trueperella sp. TaxID=2699835 RepID=UPI0025E84F7C|nr:DNA polymerase III subunit delta' [Trueperella sp.]MCI7305693.1 DNA polymerase III subunit delta' [Trueperella sp.]
MSVFDGLVGQEEAVADLTRAAQAARKIAGAGFESARGSSAMSHAWLITGPPGSGRSLAARAFAAALQCTGTRPGCGECSQCKAVMAGQHPDVSSLSTDLVTIKAEEVRAYVASSYQAPGSGSWKVFIIEDADRMVERTTNVLLKAIEEPGPRTVWLLCTAAVADVLPTIRSRCRNVNLVTPSVEEVARLLVEREGVEREAAYVAAQAAQSHIGVAKALATNPEATDLRKKTLDALASIHGVGDAAVAAWMLVDPELMGVSTNRDKAAEEREEADRLAALGLEAGGRVPAAVRSQVRAASVDSKRRATRTLHDMIDRELTYMISFYRDVVVVQLDAQVALINTDYAEAIQSVAAKIGPAEALSRIDTLGEARERLRSNVAPQLLMEAALSAMRQ